MNDDDVCMACSAMYEVDCDACNGTGVEYFGHDPDWCSSCGGCGTDWIPAHPVGEAQA